MPVNFDINKTINSFDAPDFLKWFIMPFVILLVLGYIVGFTFVYKDVRKGGYSYKKYDEECEKQNKLECSSLNDDKKYRSCLQHKNDARCNYTMERSGRIGPILAYTFVPLFIALMLSSLLYKVLLYIKNPRVAGGVFVYRALFGK